VSHAPGEQSDYERIGGQPVVERVIQAFVQRAFNDFIIGFLFTGRDQERIIRHEVEHASRVLGARVPYTGRPLDAVHRPLLLNKGHFRRRLAILRDELYRHHVDPEVVERWLEADRRLEGILTGTEDCGPPPKGA
jgi:hemoglobin